jgi:RHS repeat-associated protein
MPDATLETAPWSAYEDRLEGRRQLLRAGHDLSGASTSTRELLRRYLNDALAFGVGEASLAGPAQRADLAAALLSDVDLRQPDPIIGADIAAQLEAFASQRSIASNDPSQLAVQRSAGRIDMFGGQAIFESTDLLVPGAGLDFAFRRSYGSQSAYFGPLGANWNHPYNLWLREVGTDLVRSVRGLREDSFIRHPQFGQAGFDYWVPPDGQVGIIIEGSGSTSYIWQGPGGQRVVYEADPSRALLHRAAKLEDRFGNHLELVYDGDGRLDQVRVNHPDRRVMFSYDSQDRIVELRDYTGRACRYEYDDFGDLVAVTAPATQRYPDGLTTTYEYSSGTAPLGHNLIRVIDPRGRTVLENEFGDDPGQLNFNRVIGQRRGGDTRFEYETIVNEFDFEYGDAERPTIQVNQIGRNGQRVHHVLNAFGNLLLREEAILDGRQTRLLQWRFRNDRDGRTIAELSPEGSLTQRLYGRQLFLQTHGITDEEVRTHPALTAMERIAFGNLLAIVHRGGRTTVTSLDLSQGIWGDIFPDVFLAQAEDVVAKVTYEPDFQQVTATSDPRFTQSPDPRDPESPRYLATLTRREYSGPAGQPNLLLSRIRYPDLTLPDGSRLTNVTEEFSQYDARGRLERRRDRAGTVTEFAYYGSADGVREGYLRSETRDPGGLAVRKVQEVDARGRPTAIRHPRASGGLSGLFVTTVAVNQLDQVTALETSPPFSFVSQWSYDRAGQLERMERQLLDEDGDPVLGGLLVERYAFDSEGNLTRQSLGAADPRTELTVRHRYNESGLRDLTVSPSGRRTTRRYDGRMREVAVTRGAGTADASTVRIEYDGDDRQTVVRSGRGFTTRYDYDALGRVISVVDALGNVVRRDYDKAGNVLIERFFERRSDGTFALLARSEFSYDELHRLIQVGRNFFAAPLPVTDTEQAYRASPGPGTLLLTEYYYDAKGRLERVIDPLNRIRRAEFDALDRVVAQTDALGNRAEFRYDAHDNVVRRDDRELIRDPATGALLGDEIFSRSYSYDEIDRLMGQTDSLGNVTSLAYDSLDRVVRVTDPLGNVKRSAYDLYGRVETEEFERTASGLGGGAPLASVITRREYDEDGNLLAFVDPVGSRTTQTFDSLGRRRSVTYADDSTETHSYDRDDNLVASRDANGVLHTSVIDPLNRRTRVDVDISGAPPGLAVEGESFEEYVYDGLGRLLTHRNDFLEVLSQVDSLGQTYQEIWNFLLPSAGVPALTISREFDAVGSIVGLTYPGGRVIRYHRDALCRVARIENETKGAVYPGSSSFADRYAIADVRYRGARREQLSFGNGTSSAFAYDGGSRVIQISQLGGAAAPLLTQQYLYDAAGNVRIRNDLEATGARVGERLSYDSLYAVTKIERSSTIVPFNPTSFAPPAVPLPDPLPNRQAVIDSAIGSLAQDPANATFGYDLAGNRQSQQRLGQPALTYQTNALNQYTSVGGAGLGYDGAGNLRTRGALRFVYDSRNLLVRVRDTVLGTDLARFFHDARGRRVAEERGAVRTHLIWDQANPLEEYRTNALFVQYVHEGAPDAICQLAHSGSEYWLHRDAVGSPRLLTDPVGSVVGRHRYDPFGLTEQETGPYNPVRFAGRRLDSDLGLYDMRARSYAPELGRFVQRDPKGLAGGWNLYAYSISNPLTYTDPAGTDALGGSTRHHDFAAAEVVGRGTTHSLMATAARAAREAWKNSDSEAARYYEQEVRRHMQHLVHEGQRGMAQFALAAYVVAGAMAVGGEFYGAAGAALAGASELGTVGTFVTVGGLSGFGSSLFGQMALTGIGMEISPSEFIYGTGDRPFGVPSLAVGTIFGMVFGAFAGGKEHLDIRAASRPLRPETSSPSFAMRARANVSADPDIEAIIEGIRPSPKPQAISTKITNVETSSERISRLLEVAESGGIRWLAGDPELFEAWEAAVPGPAAGEGRDAFRALRQAMGKAVDMPGMPIHHWRFPITKYGNEAVSVMNLYLAEDSSLHTALHRAIGELSAPFAEMKWGVEPEIQSMFNFWLKPKPSGP